MPVARSALRDANTFIPKSFSDSFGYVEDPLTTRGGIYLLPPTNWNRPYINGAGAFPSTFNDPAGASYDDSEIAVVETINYGNRRYYDCRVSLASGAYTRSAAGGNNYNHEAILYSHIFWDNAAQTIRMYEFNFNIAGNSCGYQVARHNGTRGNSFNPPAGFVDVDPGGKYTTNLVTGLYADSDRIELYVNDWRFTAYHTPFGGSRYMLYDWEDLSATKLPLGGYSGFGGFNRDPNLANRTDWGWKSFSVSEF